MEFHFDFVFYSLARDSSPKQLSYHRRDPPEVTEANIFAVSCNAGRKHYGIYADHFFLLRNLWGVTETNKSVVYEINSFSPESPTTLCFINEIGRREALSAVSISIRIYVSTYIKERY